MPGIFTGFSKISAIVVLLCIFHFTVTFIYYLLSDEISSAFLSRRLSRVRGTVNSMNMSESPALTNFELQPCVQTALLGKSPISFQSNITLNYAHIHRFCHFSFIGLNIRIWCIKVGLAKRLPFMILI